EGISSATGGSAPSATSRAAVRWASPFSAQAQCEPYTPCSRITMGRSVAWSAPGVAYRATSARWRNARLFTVAKRRPSAGMPGSDSSSVRKRVIASSFMVEVQHALAAAPGQHVVKGRAQRGQRIAVADQRIQLQLAAQQPVEQAREIARRHAAAVQRREVALVPEEIGELDRAGAVRAADLQRVAAVAGQPQRKEGQRGDAGGLEGVVGAAAIGERAHRVDERGMALVVAVRLQQVGRAERACAL